MTQPYEPYEPAVPQAAPRPTVDPGRLWAGGLATALVAALIASAGILLTRGLFGIWILSPKGEGVWGDARATMYAVACAVIALLATALIHGLTAFTPRPMQFFTWIAVLTTAIAVLAPFTSGAAMPPKIATAVVNLVIGIAIGTLVAGSARSAVARHRSGWAASPAEDDTVVRRPPVV